MGQGTHLCHIVELPQLLEDLIQIMGIPPHGNGDPGQGRVFRFPHRQTVNVEAPPGEHAGNPGQHTGLVGYQRCDYKLSHYAFSFR